MTADTTVGPQPGSDDPARVPCSSAPWIDDAALLAQLLDATEENVFFKDVEGRFLRVSREQASTLTAGQGGPADVLGRTDFDFFAEANALAARAEEELVMRTGLPMPPKAEVLQLGDGSVRHREVWRRPLLDATGAVVGTFGMSHDVTERTQLLEREVRRSEELAEVYQHAQRAQAELKMILDSSPDSISRYDADLRITYINPAGAVMAGLPAVDIVGRTNRELGHDLTTIDTWEAALRSVFTTGDRVELDLTVNVPVRMFLQSRMVAEPDDKGGVASVIVVTRDLTARKLAEDALAERVVRDPLTRLANRVLLDDRIEQALVRLRRHPGSVGILFLDLDRFKVINDSLGHRAGDAILVEVAERLRATARATDTIARFGGDEFVLLCEQLASNEDAAVVAARVCRALAEPFRFEGEQIHLTGSIGIAVTSDPGTDADELIRDADAAMYLAKSRGGDDRYQFFDAEVRSRAVARLTVENQLRAAIERQEFSLVYQPLRSLSDDRLVGVEALVRWNHPERGLIPPFEFLPVAEDSNLIIPLGRWILDEACRQITEWNSARSSEGALTVSVNVSARQLSDPHLTADVAAALAKHSLAPHLLCLEVTETAVLDQTDVSEAALNSLSALGVQLALDDFGTGYSSLGHLRQFPINILKIDRMFIDGLDRGNRDNAIVGAVTALAHALGMTTVGEGIESEEQLHELQRLGCDAGQGYLLARPLTPAALEADHLGADSDGRRAAPTA